MDASVSERRIIGLIPARAGSKRLPGKNLKTVGGVSLLERAMRSARECDALTDRVVSTESDEIRTHALLYQRVFDHGERVVHRPAELAADDTQMVYVALHACNELGLADSDVLVLLQPTSPFRTAETIKRAVAAFDGNPVVSVSRVELPEHTYQMGKTLLPAEVVSPNGCVYVVGVGFLRLYRSFCLMASPLLVEGDEALDIDTRDQWIEARIRAGEVLASDPYGNYLIDDMTEAQVFRASIQPEFPTQLRTAA